jgi:signal peptidase II
MSIPRLPATFWRAAGLTICIDWLTKWAANSLLVPHQPYAVLGSVARFTLSYDARRTFWFGVPGTPYIRVPGGSPMFFAVKFLVLALILSLASRLSPAHRRWTMLFGVLFGGGAANTLEQVSRGAVVNFLDVGLGAHRWPTFNVADAALVTTCATLAYLLQRELVRERGWRRSFFGLDFRLPESLRRRDAATDAADSRSRQ